MRKGAPFRLFDEEEHRVSYTDVPRTAGYFIHDYGLENSSESVARPPMQKQVVFSHFSKWRRLWEYIIFIISVSPIWEIPYYCIFKPEFDMHNYWPFLVLDFVNLMDIYIVLHTAYLSHGVLIYDPRRIFRKNFSKGMFVFRFICSFPLTWIAAFSNKWWVYLLLAIPRLGRLRRAVWAADTFNRQLVYDSWLSVLVPVLSIWILMVHIFACFFYLCAKFEGMEQSWIAYLGWDYLSPPQHYIVSVYFVMTTVFAIGYGDLTPQTSSETILVICIQLIGVCSNAYLLGIFVSRLIDAEETKFLHNYGTFKEFLGFKGIEDKLTTKINHYFAHKWKTNHGSEDPAQVNRFVPETVRNHLKRDMCESMLLNISTFKIATPQFRLNMIKMLRSVEYIPGEIIIKQGETDPDLQLLDTGVISVYQNNTKVVTCECHGTTYGEQELLVDLPRPQTVVAVTHVNGWKLTREDFQIAVGSQPGMKREMLEIVKLLFPDFYKDVRRLLSQNAVDLLLKENTSSDGEYGSSDIAVALQDSSSGDEASF